MRTILRAVPIVLAFALAIATSPAIAATILGIDLNGDIHSISTETGADPT